jgi:hypothetical protein
MPIFFWFQLLTLVQAGAVHIIVHKYMKKILTTQFKQLHKMVIRLEKMLMFFLPINGSFE